MCLRQFSISRLNKISTTSLQHYLARTVKLTTFSKCSYLKTIQFGFFHGLSTKTTTESPSELIKTISKLLSCKEIDVLNIYNVEPLLKERGIATIKQRVDYLIENQVTPTSITEYPFLLVNQNLETNLGILKSMKPTDINHFVPLLQLEPLVLRKFKWMYPNNGTDSDQRHFIYYFSEKTGVEPQIICEFLIHRPKLFHNCNFKSMTEKIDILLQYIDARYILRDLTVMKHSTKYIVDRMEQVKLAGIDSPRPWMIKILQKRLDITIKSRLAEKEAKGENIDTIHFFSERLNLNIDNTKLFLDKHPILYKSRLRRVSKIIDYLLNEANYTASDIVGFPRILSFSLYTISNRVETLKSIGIQKINLNLVGQGSERYEKTVQRAKKFIK